MPCRAIPHRNIVRRLSTGRGERAPDDQNRGSGPRAVQVEHRRRKHLTIDPSAERCPSRLADAVGITSRHTREYRNRGDEQHRATDRSTKDPTHCHTPSFFVAFFEITYRNRWLEGYGRKVARLLLSTLWFCEPR